jgi:hypothetical protein
MLILCNGQCPQLFRVYCFSALCAVTEGASAMTPWFLQDEIAKVQDFKLCLLLDSLKGILGVYACGLYEQLHEWNNPIRNKWCMRIRGINSPRCRPPLATYVSLQACRYKVRKLNQDWPLQSWWRRHVGCYARHVERAEVRHSAQILREWCTTGSLLAPSVGGLFKMAYSSIHLQETTGVVLATI